MISYSVSTLVKSKDDKSSDDNDKDDSDSDSDSETKYSDENKSMSDSVKVMIYNAGGKLIRTLRHKPDTAGINRVYWGLDIKGVRNPASKKPKAGSHERGGLPVLPGTFKAVLTYNGVSDSTNIVVHGDPRIKTNASDMLSGQLLRIELYDNIAKVTKATDNLVSAQEMLKKIKEKLSEDKFKEDTVTKALLKEGKKIKKAIETIMVEVRGKKEMKGIYRDPETLNAKLGTARYHLSGLQTKPSETQRTIVKLRTAEMEAVVKKVNELFEQQWKPFKEKVEKFDFSPFEDIDPVKW